MSSTTLLIVNLLGILGVTVRRRHEIVGASPAVSTSLRKHLLNTGGVHGLDRRRPAKRFCSGPGRSGEGLCPTEEAEECAHLMRYASTDGKDAKEAKRHRWEAFQARFEDAFTGEEE